MTTKKIIKIEDQTDLRRRKLEKGDAIEKDGKLEYIVEAKSNENKLSSLRTLKRDGEGISELKYIISVDSGKLRSFGAAIYYGKPTNGHNPSGQYFELNKILVEMEK
jgi:Zn-dependent metalloprotease